MKNVLFLIDEYLPNTGANVVCVSNIVHKLLENNINVSIICLYDEMRKKENIGSNNFRIYDINRVQRKKHSKITYYLKWIFIKKHFPTENKKIIKEMFQKADEVIMKNDIDTVICTHFPVESLIVGNMLKEKYEFLNIVAYMLDSLSGGFLPRLLPTTYCLKKKLYWEHDMLSCFDLIILMESSRRHHEKFSKNEEWYKNARFLDVPTLCKTPNVVDGSGKCGETITLSFVGTMCDGVRTPYAFLKILAKISNLKVKVIFAGRNSCVDLLDYLKDSKNVTLEIIGEVPYNEAQKIIKESDFLINFGNTNPNLVPSKIFEYMSYGKPIISTYTCDSDSSIPYLLKYPLVFLIDERIETTKQISEKLELFIKENKEKQVSYSTIVEKFYNNTPDAFYDLLSTI